MKIVLVRNFICTACILKIKTSFLNIRVSLFFLTWERGKHQGIMYKFPILYYSREQMISLFHNWTTKVCSDSLEIFSCGFLLFATFYINLQKTWIPLRDKQIIINKGKQTVCNPGALFNEFFFAAFTITFSKNFKRTLLTKTYKFSLEENDNLNLIFPCTRFLKLYIFKPRLKQKAGRFERRIKTHKSGISN